MLLHDHLDGGLRPGTVLELARAAGHSLPADDVAGLSAWFFQGGGRNVDLVRYLGAFEHTIALLQTTDNLARVARECAEDLAEDGIIHAEVRYAPELSTHRGLTYDEVIGAILGGFDEGPPGLTMRLIVCAMRDRRHADAAFTAAARWREAGVVAIDLAGPEAGYPASAHAAAIARAREAGLGVTLHAGEAAGPASIADALEQGAQRLGHGVRIIDDIDDGGLGPIATEVLTKAVPLEVCPTSNVHTGICSAVAGHPIDQLRRAGFAVTLNTDNRLMSDVRMSDEVVALHSAFGDGLDDLAAMTGTAVDAAFLTDAERAELRNRVERGYAALGA